MRYFYLVLGFTLVLGQARAVEGIKAFDLKHEDQRLRERQSGGDGVGNGGGSAEKTVLMANSRIIPILRDCLLAECVTDKVHVEILTNIVGHFNGRPPNERQIRFRDSGEYPFSKYLHKPPRTMRTGNTPGSYIYVNRSHLYRRGSERNSPIAQSTALGWLVDEYAHMTGYGMDRDHDVLDRAAFLVERFAHKHIQSLHEIFPGIPGSTANGITLTTYSSNNTKNWSDVVISNPLIPGSPYSGKRFSLSQDIGLKLDCTALGVPMGFLSGYSLSNLHWVVGDNMNDPITKLRAIATYGCHGRTVQNRSTEIEIDLELVHHEIGDRTHNMVIGYTLRKLNKDSKPRSDNANVKQ